ncbi:aminotransferase class I/II-fold pyridoxal phosphate-dependent enzyme [Motiliproteus sp. MSK22-1]|uniref:aminotransferase class I/II-fold pyridoxal phosphate-dependent enzyme n=1 Tax=Motiliproteus sp. MSK22-1 TaxID=1897630 RepID=UPI000977339C|nr:aminotransferase class I/II-fold pyridoxal phosphate-dependent enzyme [Motiliproteus sp. MSK22-1]OMH39238.1 aminotransferase [Motiliproteus sp. MSK22-1]
MRNFALEVYLSCWEFSAQYHMTASDNESMSMADLLEMASEEDRNAFQQSWLGYTETWGAADLRAAIAATYNDIAAKNVLTFAGAGEGIYAAMNVLLSKDDHAIVITPNYQSAETVPLQLCQVSGVGLREEEGWALDIDEIAAAIRPTTRLISINFPNNPTGAVLPRNRQDELVALCRKHGLYLFSDEVYRGVERDPEFRAPQVADLYEKGLSLNVMSKAYGLPGLRIGWIACQDDALLEKIEHFKHYLSICNSVPSEKLALIALRNRERIFATNKKLIVDNLALTDSMIAQSGGLLKWHKPQGGCVGFVEYLGRDGVDAFCSRLVEEKGVLLLPSSLYKSELGSTPCRHFRLGFGRQGNWQEGLRVLQEHVRSLA